MSRLRVGVLVSGTGSLLESIIASQDEHYEVAVVVSDRAGIRALEIAERAGIPAKICDFKSFASREEFSAAVAKSLLDHGVDLSVNAGFMRILTLNFVEAFRGRALNSHPALLPSFPGAHGVREALSWGVKVTGTTIHFVAEDFDQGPIVVQEAVPVLPGDSEESLHERIKESERRLYPEVIRLFAQGRLLVEGRLVRVLPPTVR